MRASETSRAVSRGRSLPSIARAALGWIVLAQAVGLAPGCGRGAAELPLGTTQQLAWSRVEASELEGPARLARYQVFSNRPGWAVMAAKSSVDLLELEDGEKLRALWLSGPLGEERAFEVRIDGNFDPHAIDLVQARLVFRGTAQLRASLSSQGQEVSSGSAEVTGSDGPVAREVRLGAPRLDVACDQLVLRLEGAERLGVIELELFREPTGAALPPLEAPAPIELSGEWRRAAGLVAGDPVETRFRPRTGHSLRVDYGLPEHLRGPEPPERIELTLTGSGGIQHTYELSFEYDRVVTYSEHDPEFLEQRKARLRRVRTRGGRVAAGAPPAKRRPVAELPAGAFGEDADPTLRRPARPGQGPADGGPSAQGPTLQGPIDGWISRTVSLEDFVGQEVTARLDLLVQPGREAICAIGTPLLLGSPLLGANGDHSLMVLVTSDAHRADHFSAAGLDGAIETPWIELLGRRGAVFADAWSPTNDPRAAWASIFTGRAPGPHSRLAEGEARASLPALLAERGWLTVAIVSSPLFDPARDGLLGSFEQVLAPSRLGPGAERSGFDAKQALDTLVELLPDLGEQPTFVWVQLEDALAPYEPPEEFRGAHYPEGRNPRRAPRDSSSGSSDPRSVPEWAQGIADVAYVEALYSAEVTWIDRRLRPLVEHPRLARGVLVLAGTSGESLHSFSHERLVPDTLRVPLLVTAPGLGGQRVDRPVSLLDLGRTLLDLARLHEVPFPGESLLQRARAQASLAQDPSQQAPPVQVQNGAADEPPIHFAVDADGTSAVAIRGEALVRVALDSEGRPRGRAECFDLSIDPEAEVDLSLAEPVLTTSLAAALATWLETPRLAAPSVAPVLAATGEAGASGPARPGSGRSPGPATGGGPRRPSR